jgi:Ca2+-binding EF-hand superfamily protein
LGKTDRVKKNSKGGVLITPEEIQLAFQMFEPDKNGAVSLQNLKKRLSVLFPELTLKDYR